MKWLDRWLYRKFKNAWENKTMWEDDGQINIIKMGTAPHSISKGGGELDAYPDLTFRMYRAYNGFVMEVRNMDKKTDRHTVTLHLIADGEDLGDNISKIITLESLRI